MPTHSSWKYRKHPANQKLPFIHTEIAYVFKIIFLQIKIYLSDFVNITVVDQLATKHTKKSIDLELNKNIMKMQSSAR